MLPENSHSLAIWVWHWEKLALSFYMSPNFKYYNLTQCDSHLSAVWQGLALSSAGGDWALRLYHSWMLRLFSSTNSTAALICRHCLPHFPYKPHHLSSHIDMVTYSWHRFMPPPMILHYTAQTHQTISHSNQTSNTTNKVWRAGKASFSDLQKTQTVHWKH